jgi:hypothetical protein
MQVISLYILNMQNMQNMQNNMQKKCRICKQYAGLLILQYVVDNMQICKEEYAKYAKHVSLIPICRICTPHFADSAATVTSRCDDHHPRPARVTVRQCRL